MTTDFDIFSNKYSHDIFLQKYSIDKQERWSDTCRRVVSNVAGQLLPKEEQEEIYQIMVDRKFIPGGRYLRSAGRQLHQISNCFLFKAEDSREGWADAMSKATAALMTGGGIGFDYSSLREEGALIRRTGGASTGPIALMNMVNEAGRYIIQGGERRSAVWAGLSWSHGDIKKFMDLKNWSSEIKKVKETNFNFPAPMELTNISVIYDTEFFVAIEDSKHPKHKLAKEVWQKNCLQAFSTAEPGMSFNFMKDAESARNACQPGFAKLTLADGTEITMDKLKVGDILLNCNNKETKVIKKWSNGIKPVYAYACGTGGFVGTSDHKVVIKNENGVVTKDEISNVYYNNHCLEICTPVGNFPVSNRMYLGMYEVFDITVDDDTHTYLTNGVYVSNCTEVTSEDDSDKCNLGTIWINRVKDKEELAHVTRLATRFLLCGGIYSDTPTDKIKLVGNKNNRIGLGLGGIHEWLMVRGEGYNVTPELHKWLRIYEQESDGAAYVGAKFLGVAVPKGVRAIAPNGTIGILAETTTGIEPLFCKAYKRRYLVGKDWKYQFVVDGAVKRLMQQGVPVEKIQDSFDLTFKERVKFQADVQNYVDMAISSTCNIPSWGSEFNNEETLKANSKTLLKYAKRLRGFTVYPNGARGGQPLTRVELDEAIKKEGTVYEETVNECVNGICGI